jgi:hypothetical protein
MKRFVFSFVVVVVSSFAISLFLVPSAKAQGTYTAATCNSSDVNAVINGPKHTAVNGDIIQIPAGSCTWTSSITVPPNIGITIIGTGTPNSGPASTGAGTVNTIITGGGFTMHPTYGNQTSRISTIKFQPGTAPPITVDGTCTASGCPNLRFDNLVFPSSWASVGLPDASVAFVSNVFGVADHNTVGDTDPNPNYMCFLNIGHGSWQGVGSWGDNSYASPDTFGTVQTFFIENNTINYALVTDTDIGGSNGGGARLACRFNTINSINAFGVCSGHGTDTTGRPRGVRQWEGYYNTGTCSNGTVGCGSAWPGRGGTGMSFGNSFTNTGSGFFKGLADLNPQRRWRSSTYGPCDGSSPWDQNDGTTYFTGTIGSTSGGGSPWTVTDSGSPGWAANRWVVNGSPYSFHDVTQNAGLEIGSNSSNSLTTNDYTSGSAGATNPSLGDSYQILRAAVCMDQPTRGAGLLITGSISSPVLASTGKPGSAAQALDPIYEAADNVGNHADHTIVGVTQALIANRDYYAESINQTAQTSPASPFNGTSGAGHGTLANRPTTCTKGVGYWATDQGNWNQSGSGGQGELFVCSATNTWTIYYMPYTYPHPLTTGNIGNPPAPPTGLMATVQ